MPRIKNWDNTGKDRWEHNKKGTVVELIKVRVGWAMIVISGKGINQGYVSYPNKLRAKVRALKFMRGHPNG
jgi:hypothetical protein